MSSAFRILQTALHLLMAVLVAVVAARSFSASGPVTASILVLLTAFAAVYAVGVMVASYLRWWLVGLTVIWIGLIVLSAEAGYLVFGLFFLYLAVLPARWGLCAVATSLVVTVVSFTVHSGWSVAAVVGPVLGAGVATVISLGYQRLYRDARERQALIDELRRTRKSLAEQQHSAGRMAERERLAEEIHDTVAQSLSSIGLLLHAADKAAPDSPASEQIALARHAAAEALTETRQLIADLGPAQLIGQSLADALASVTESAQGMQAEFVVDGDPVPLPMPYEATLVRVAQGAVSNAVRHSGAANLRVTLTYSPDSVHLDVADDGRGFDRDTVGNSFGLKTIRRRVAELGGSTDIDSGPSGTVLAVMFASPRPVDMDVP